MHALSSRKKKKRTRFINISVLPRFFYCFFFFIILLLWFYNDGDGDHDDHHDIIILHDTYFDQDTFQIQTYKEQRPFLPYTFCCRDTFLMSGCTKF